MLKSKLVVLLFLSLTVLLASCTNTSKKNRLSPEEQSRLIAKGRSISAFSLKAFTRELTNALNEGGVQHAVGYCNLRAMPLIDSLSGAYNVKIYRISEKYRNKVNMPGQLDITVLKAYQKQLDNGEELQPHLEVTENEVIFYSPIILLNPICLNCHGEPGSTMTAENHSFIKSKYPEDLAFGYKLGDLRGVWKIVMSPEF